MTEMAPVIRLLADLVAIPSMNPMGRPHDGALYSEGTIAAFVARYLGERGIRTEVSEVSPGRPNVLGYIDGRAEQTILLEAHMDTVHADSMEIDPFTPEISNGRLFGRGACDTKASLAAFLRAACSFVESGRLPKFNVVIAAVSDEEYRFSGARHAVLRGLRADFGIAGEPTGLQIVRAHKGVTRWYIRTEGIAAHSAYPERGVNAIYTMAHVVTRLEALGNALLMQPSHPLLGAPTLSVGVIEGGQAVNVVPDRCLIEVDRRTLPGETSSGVLGPVRDSLRGLEGWIIEEPHLSVAGMEVDEDSPVVLSLAASVSRTGGEARINTAHYATDAGIYNEAGIPTVVFGPGDIAQAHTSREYVEVDQVIRAEAIVRDLLS